MDKGRFVILGLSRVALELLKRLPKEFRVTCVDKDPAAEAKLEGIERADVEFMAGDATSRLVLEEAAVDEADAIFIVTTNEEADVEAATLLKEHFNPRRVIAVALTQKGAETLESLGVEVEYLYNVIAMAMRNLLEKKTKAASAIGIGKDEILEVEVHPNSRLANKALGSLAPMNWRVGIVYRDGNIVVPRPDTVLKAKDKVVILGEPPVLKTVSDILTFNFEMFPLEYGSTLMVYMTGGEDERFLEEVRYVYDSLPLKRVVLMCPENTEATEVDRITKAVGIKDLIVRKTVLSPAAAVVSMQPETGRDEGLVVLSDEFLKSKGGIFGRVRAREMVQELMSVARCPVLVARGTFPYEKSAVTCINVPNHELVLDTALEIASVLNNEVTALHVRPSAYIEGEEEFRDFDEMKRMVSSLSVMHKKKVLDRELSGNPVRAILGVIGEYNLMLAAGGALGEGGWLSAFLSPDVTWSLVMRSQVSTLLLHPLEKAL